jgi:hypothetical protein
MFVWYPHDIFDDCFGSVESAEHILNYLYWFSYGSVFAFGILGKGGSGSRSRAFVTRHNQAEQKNFVSYNVQATRDAIIISKESQVFKNLITFF